MNREQRLIDIMFQIAMTSAQHFHSSSNEDVFAELIRNDMVFHSGTMEEIQEYCKNPLAKHSYATSWAEIYANAELFGGVESTSFKIKKKKLIRALKYVI